MQYSGACCGVLATCSLLAVRQGLWNRVAIRCVRGPEPAIRAGLVLKELHPCTCGEQACSHSYGLACCCLRHFFVACIDRVICTHAVKLCHIVVFNRLPARHQLVRALGQPTLVASTWATALEPLTPHAPCPGSRAYGMLQTQPIRRGVAFR